MSDARSPRHLQAGDTVRIVPTARAITAEELAFGISTLESWGLQVELAENVGAKHFQSGGTDQERARAINQALQDKHVRAIWCARGGYGTVRTLDLIDAEAFKADPKWIVGFSDITALHNYANQRGIMSLHAQMPFALDKKSPETLETLRKGLWGESFAIATEPHPSNQQGEIEAELVGGNLSVLYSLRGSRHDLDVRDKILFLEDLDELYYHVDRMFQNLKNSDWGVQVAGVIIGGMSDLWDKNEKDPFGVSVEDMVLDVFGGRSIPICFGFPSGHTADNQALVLGKKAKLSVGANDTKLSFNA